tara:strand:- start:3341 stop:3892 length:552 start_codon:yes stop_codon:yes gene_type:complete
MLFELYKFQRKNLSCKDKTFIKSIDSGIFTGLRNKKGLLKEEYKVFYEKNYKIYSKLRHKINKINKDFFNIHTQYRNKQVILYRGLDIFVNKYEDIIPTSYTCKKKVGLNFLLDNTSLLKYKCNNLLDLIINFNENEELNEYEIILPPQKYKINNYINKKHTYKINNEEVSFNYIESEIGIKN